MHIILMFCVTTISQIHVDLRHKPLMVPNQSYRSIYKTTEDLCPLIIGQKNHILISRFLVFLTKFGEVECPIKANVTPLNTKQIEPLIPIYGLEITFANLIKLRAVINNCWNWWFKFYLN